MENDAKDGIKKVAAKGDAIEALQADLKDLNTDALTAKAANARGIWNAKSLGDTPKKARRMLRRSQMQLCKALLHSIVTKQEKGIIIANAESLSKFNATHLQNGANYSNVSSKESPEKREILDKAYNALATLLK